MYYATDRWFHSYSDVIQHGKSFTFFHLCFRQMSVVTARDRTDKLWQNVLAWPTYTFVSYSNGSTSTCDSARILRRVGHEKKYWKTKTKHSFYNLLRATCKEYNTFTVEEKLCLWRQWYHTSTAENNNLPEQIQFALSQIIYCEREIYSLRKDKSKKNSFWLKKNFSFP